MIKICARLCSNKLQINDVPFTADENLFDIIITIAAKLRITIVCGDISDVVRVKQTRKKTINANATMSNNSNAFVNADHPATIIQGPIIVEFFSKAIRNKLFESYRKNNEIYFDIDKKCRIFINEYLSSSNRRLFYKAKLFCKEHNFKYLWTKNGEILMKKEDGGKVLRVNRFTDFANLDDGMVSGAARLG